jgi:putative sterol carrier protein
MILAALLLGAFFLVLYGRQLFQEGNPIPVLFGVAKLQFSESGMASISSEKYITRSANGREFVVTFMQDKGCAFVEQLGSGYIFECRDEREVVTRRAYSRWYAIWHISK